MQKTGKITNISYMKTMFLTKSYFLRSKQTKRNLKTKKDKKQQAALIPGFTLNP